MTTHISCLTLVLFCLLGFGSMAVHPAWAQETAADPLISLTVDHEPLGDALDTIALDTGYQFRLDRKWQDHPVSATIGNLPLEQGLKRLLRSLNHTIVWEPDRTITITVFGKAEAASPGSAMSFAEPSRTEPEETETVDETEHRSADETEPPDTGGDLVADEAATADETEPEPADASASRDAGRPDASSAEPTAEDPSDAQAPPGDPQTVN